MVMTADNLERQRKSIINGTFERTSDMEVSGMRLDTIIPVTSLPRARSTG